MTWQTIVKDSNLDVSEISFSKLMGRFDAEYYKPAFIVGDKILESKYIKKISQIAEVRGGKRLPKGESFSTEGIPYIRAEDVKNSFVQYENSPKISVMMHQKLKSYQTKINDVLVTIVGNSIGDVGIVKFDIDKCNLTENCAKIINLKEINPDYLFIFLLSKYGRNQINREKVGTSQPKLALVRIRDFTVPIPNNDFQKSITNLVLKSKALKDASVLAYSEAETILLKELSLINHIPNEDSLSIRELSECLKDNRFDAEYWQPKYDELEKKIRDYKQGFDTLDNLFTISNKVEKIEAEKEYLYVELADVNNLTGTVDNFTPLKGSELPSRGKMILKQNDLILSSVEGSLEKVAVIASNEKNIIGSTGFFVLKEKEYEPEVALVLLKSKPIQALLKRQAQGTILTAIPKPSINRIILPKIDKGVQLKIKELIISAKKQRLEAQELLEKAKQAVEIFIEKDEVEALKLLNN